MFNKRHRSLSASSSSSIGSSSSTGSAAPKKAAKQPTLPPSVASVAFTCSLPPTCSRSPIAFASSAELSAHYARLHALKCDAELPNTGDAARGKARQCGKLFPEPRLLELHQNEFHNPLLAIASERGERIYECYLPPSLCDRKFSTPKKRRLHLIAKHAYPAEYFFAIVKEGIGGLVKEQGQGASLLRPVHVPRPPTVAPVTTTSSAAGMETTPSDTAQGDISPLHFTLPTATMTAARTHAGGDDDRTRLTAVTPPMPDDDDDDPMDGLVSSMRSASLAFVPRAVGRRRTKAVGTG